MFSEDKQDKENFAIELLAVQQASFIENSPENLRAAFQKALRTKKLSLQSLRITDQEVTQFIVPFLNITPDILQVDLSNNQIGPAGATAIAGNTTAIHWDLAGNRIGPAGATAIAGNTTAIHWNLSFNQIGDPGAIAIAGNTTAIHWNLSDNQIGPAGATAIAGNITATHWDLSFNQIGDPGATAIAGNTTITDLNISANKISVSGAIAIAGNTRIAGLDIAHNHIDYNACALITAITKNRTLSTLTIDVDLVQLTQQSLAALQAIPERRALEYNNRAQAFAFLSGTQKRLGAGAPILTAFSQHPLFDPNLMHVILGFQDVVPKPFTLKFLN